MAWDLSEAAKEYVAGRISWREFRKREKNTKKEIAEIRED